MEKIETAAKKYVENMEIDTPIIMAYNAFKAGVAFAELWISVDKELPKIKCKVFVKLDNGEVYTDFWFGYWFTWGDNVKSWRPIKLG